MWLFCLPDKLYIWLWLLMKGIGFSAIGVSNKSWNFQIVVFIFFRIQGTVRKYSMNIDWQQQIWIGTITNAMKIIRVYGYCGVFSLHCANGRDIIILPNLYLFEKKTHVGPCNSSNKITSCLFTTVEWLPLSLVVRRLGYSCC